MGRQHYKNTSTNRKMYMTPPESRDSTLARPEHHNADEAEENILKNYFMKMIEALKEDMRQSLKEMEEKTNQKMQEINKSLKKTRKAKKKKTMKETIQIIQTIQDLKTEIKTKKKTQNEGMLEIEKPGK
ncbi:Putative transposase element L1Md-A101/L1Md-A102/L1Md-A2 [Cricetulus griseus]|uniref:Putative transposase element L1Md-A101/L1Md-A102/L1Md-A2 n=1 Tax=Cricetulus griseus TaxID=10029 RepID=G3H7R8_CRIGR|nr:Putative transposase element L1Md-A101/L1Md-A102/L1Md-A2 [Cricetulus griseus]